MTYHIKEIFYSLQGEGGHAGRPAVFCRFSRCNLWTGREKDRPRAVCQFCDTDFVGTDGPGGGRYPDAGKLVDAIESKWPENGSRSRRFVVCTGGEPLLQLDGDVIDALHMRDFTVAVETNGTVTPPPGLDWICVSPKAGTTLAVTGGDELKLVYPQSDLDPTRFEELDFRSFRLQPKDGPDLAVHTKAAVEFCLDNPLWSLSLQTHKILGIQ